MTRNCYHARCDEDAAFVAHCDTGQEKPYCPDHAGGDRAGHARVEKWRSL